MSSAGIVPIGIQRIEKRLELIVPHLDMTDYEGRPAAQSKPASLSRALAAYCVKLLTGSSDETAAKSVTDSFHDRGIDAICYDQKSSRLIVVQSKWSLGIDWKECGEFVDGVRKLVTANWEKFTNNQRIYDRRNEINIALRSDAKIVLVTVHHGPSPANTGTLNRVTDLAVEIAGGSDLAEAIHWHQSDLLLGLQQESEPPRMDADLVLANCVEIKEPYYAVFGRIQGHAIAELWKKHPHLAHMNLRDYSRRSDINLAIGKTAREEPENFWYFNNGLTIICESIRPAILGRLQTEVALFHLEGISLVNGAQTSGIVADNFDLISDENKSKLWIQIRAIAVKNCPDGFAKRVTKFTNLQNAISVQDFLGLDPIHSRIATDFAIAKRKYAFRWGDEDPTGEKGCTLKEVTVALACAHPDPWYSTQAKREISYLWNTDSDKYKALFQKTLTATRIWNAVKIMRAADWILCCHEDDVLPKASMVANHLQRTVLHVVFQDPEIAGWNTESDPNAKLPKVEKIAERVFQAVVQDVVKHHASDYLASLSKNHEKCTSLVNRILNRVHLPRPPGEGWLDFGPDNP